MIERPRMQTGRPDLAADLSANARTVLEKRYLIRDAEGKVAETPEELFWRVATAVASVEKDSAEWADRFYRFLVSLDFVPNSPCLMNAGRRLGQLFACFVLPVSDAIASGADDGIFDTIRSTAVIHQSGGGTGFDFSHLRPEGSIVASTRGRSSGPISFMRVFNAATNAIHQGGFRRGANMGILRVDHPDILDFIRLKSDLREMTNFNLSVGVTDAFVRAVRGDQPHLVTDLATGRSFPLRAKTRDAEGAVTGYETKEWSAREVFDLIVRRARDTGEPGVIFLDRINDFNPTPHVGRMEATNPCVTGDTRVWVEEAGWIPIRELMGRAPSIATSGGFRKATRVVRTGVKPVFRLRTHEGFELRLTEDHRVTTDRGDVPTSELQPGDRVRLLEIAPPSVDRESPGARLGEVVGWLTGDGHFTLHEVDKPTAVLSFYGADKKGCADRLLESVRTLVGDSSLRLNPVDSRDLAYVRSSRLRSFLAERGIGEDCKRRLPEAVWRGGPDLIAGYLRALFSADGSVQGRIAKGLSVRLASNEAPLLRDVQVLLLSLGIRSVLYTNRRVACRRLLPDGRGGVREYECAAQHELVVSRASLPAFAKTVGFLLAGKEDALQSALASYVRGPYRESPFATVSEIEADGEEDVYDLTEPETNHFVAQGILVHNCGEQPLLPFEACNLGSIHLSRFVGPDQRFQWERYADAIRLGVRFLDDVIDANLYPKEQIEAIVKGNRKIGLGLMGWADLLYRLEIRYDSDEALAFARTLMKFTKEEGWKASMELSRERGPFPNFEGSLFTTERDHPYFAEVWREETRKLGRPAPIRNATITTIAPTGTISIIAGASGGIEPLFSLAFHRNVLNGEQLLEVNPVFTAVAKREGFWKPELVERIAREGTAHGIEEIPARWRNVFVCAHDVAPEWHMRMQAAFQEYTDNAVSKTVNFPESATVEDVRRVYELALDLGVKGVTVYRDGSRAQQPMALARGNGGAGKRPVPEQAEGKRYRVPTNLGKAYVTITEDAQGPREVFTSIGKCGSDISALSEAICRVVSTALGYGVPMQELAEQLLNITSQPVPWNGGWVKSLPDAIGQAMMRYLRAKSDVAGKATGFLCPECGASLRFEEGCSGGKCTCGFSRC